MLASSTTMLAHADIMRFKPTIPKFSNTSAERKANNQLYSLGEATFLGGIKVPVYGVTALNPVDDGLLKDDEECSIKNCHFNFKLDSNQARQLKLLKIPEIGLVLVPRQWQDIEAHAGANGTGSALIMSPDQHQTISLYDSSFCVGCGMPYATLYFPHLTKQSIDYEYGAYNDPQKLLTVIHPSKTVAFFSYRTPNFKNKTHGVAKYIDDGDFNFREIKVTLDSSQQSLTTTILNFYNAMH